MMDIRIGGVPEHFNLPWHLAIESGAFKAKGLNVIWSNYKGGTGDLSRDLQEEKLDIAIGLTDGLIKGISRGNPCKIQRIYVQSPLNWGIFTGNNSYIANTEQLHSRKFAISRKYSGSHLMAMVYAWQNNVVLNDDQFVIVNDLDGAKAALVKGEADLFFWEMAMTMPLVNSGDFRLVGQVFSPWSCFSIAVHNNFLINKAVLKALYEVIYKQCIEFKDSVTAVDVVVQRYKLDAGDTKAWFENLEYGKNKKVSKTEIDRIVKILVKFGILEGAVSAEKLLATY